jgi:hypothetical protein
MTAPNGLETEGQIDLEADLPVSSYHALVHLDNRTTQREVPTWLEVHGPNIPILLVCSERCLEQRHF